MKRVLIPIVLSVLSVAAFAQVKKTSIQKKPITAKAKTTFKAPAVKAIPGTRIKITTDSGVIIVRLYDKTPQHKANFIKLVSEHFYDSLIFHRVINEFMIQGGDPGSKNASYDMMLGSGDVGYMVPAEFDTTLYHKKGALAAARNNNPEKASSGCQFYIVQGKKYTDPELNQIEMQTGHKFSRIQRMVYKEKGGTPFLDMNYTVFGEVEKGLEVIDKIASVPKNQFDRPLGDVRMKMEIIKQ